MNPDELENARTNPEFLQYLEKKELEAIEKEDLESLYETLDNLLILDLDVNRINKVYETILKVAFETVENRLNDGGKLNLISSDTYLIRAFYEHAVEKWSCENYDGAKQIFFILSRIIEDKKLSSAIKIHLIACSKLIDIDKFYDTLVSKEQILDDETYGYFIVNFKIDTKEYISQNREILGELLDELGHLLG